jgi:dienelactone hydrolase
MTRKIITNLGMVFVLAVLIACATTVDFKSLDPKNLDEMYKLRGKLTKPRGDGPFPAIVLLHGCAGPSERDYKWARKLKRWGFVTLMVDSFGPRGESNLCEPGRSQIISFSRRGKDALGAKLYLANLPYVDRNRIAVMGWSHGGSSTLWAVKIYEPNIGPFQAAIAFYPWCIPMFDIHSPLLILIGEKDDWTPANRCKLLLPKKSEQEIILKVYPDAYHAFDAPFGLTNYLGHKIGRNLNAAKDANDRIKAFLEKHLLDH